MNDAALQILGHVVPWQTLGDLLADKHACHGDAAFAEIAGTPVTYRELDLVSQAVATNLLASGLAKGDRVATFMLNAPEQLYTWFGCARAGLVWVPLNAGLVGEDLAYTLRNSGARVLIADEECGARFAAIRGTLPPIRLVVTDETPAMPGAEPFAALRAAADTSALPATLGGDAAVILYTGGTTGLPKGVVLSQFSFILAGLRYGEAFGVRAGERHFSTMPLFHAGALQWGIMGPLVNDMTTVVDRRFSASNYLNRLHETKADVIDAFGVVVSMLCRQPPSSVDRQHQVRLSVGAVHGLAPEIPLEFTRRFGIPLLLLYGLTEGGGAMLTTNRDRLTGSNGKPHGWVEIRIADEHGLPVPPGTVGDVLLRPTQPDMFMQGYFADAEKSLASFRDCWLQTGDLGKLEADGNFWFIGRKSHWLRRRGESISAVEVETILQKYPGVHEAAVVPAASEFGDDEVKAFLVPSPGTALDPTRVAEWCAAQMAAFKIPRYIEFIDALPRSTAKMEIDRGELRRRSNEHAWDRGSGR